MKNLFKILFFVIILIISCNSPEKQIIRNLREGDHLRFKIENVKIIDTLYENQISKILDENEIRIDSLQKEIKNVNAEIKDLYKNNRVFAKNIVDSLLKDKFNKSVNLAREISYYERQSRFYREIFYHTEDSICGYVVIVKTKYHEFKYVITKDYDILGPGFLFK
jgi:hypothetical protein